MKKIVFYCMLAVLCLMPSVASGETKTSYRNAMIFAYSQANSVYEDDNILLEIYNEQLWAKNKTSKTIFIDLAQSFAYHNGSSMPLGDDGKRKQGDKKASKMNISTKDDIYLSIAPAMGISQQDTYICNLSMAIYGKYTTSESPSGDFTDYDKRLLMLIESILNESKEADPNGKYYLGTVTRHLTEDESVNNIGVSLAYAFNKNAEEWTNISTSTWVSDVIFSPYYVEMPKDLKKKDKVGFGIKETAPAIIHVKAETPFEFDEDKSPLIVCDWEGNYKKGEFTLSSTWISKTKKNWFKFVGGLLVGGQIGTWALLTSFEEIYYKKIIHFDGNDTDWGKMTYVSGGANKTRQKN